VLAQKRVATIQTLGGSGALKVGADFLKNTSRIPACGSAIRRGKTTLPSSKAQVLRSPYPWFDSETNGVRVEALLEKLNTLPERSIVLLHPAAITQRAQISPIPVGCGD
jgi:aromatic-amino-acid transaminase